MAGFYTKCMYMYFIWSNNHEEARRKFILLEGVKSDFVYEIENDFFAAGNPRAIYQMKPIVQNCKGQRSEW